MVMRALYLTGLAAVAAVAVYGVFGLVVWGPGSLGVDTDGARNTSPRERPFRESDARRLLRANLTLAEYCVEGTGEDARRPPAERLSAALDAADGIVSIARAHPHERLYAKPIREVLIDDAAIISDCFPEQASRFEQTARGLP